MKEDNQSFADRILGGKKHSLIVTCLFFIYIVMFFLGFFFYFHSTIYTLATSMVLIGNGCYVIVRLLTVKFSKRRS